MLSPLTPPRLRLWHSRAHRMPAVEMIASQCEWPDAVYSVLDRCVEIAVLRRDECQLKLLSPVGVPTQGNVKYPLHLIYSPLCPSSSFPWGPAAGQEVLLFFFFYKAKCFN